MKVKKKLVAILCCVALVATSIYVSEPKKADAATATSTMSFNTVSINGVLGFKIVANGGSGYLNIPYTGVASDYSSNGSNFLDAAFAEEYITFAGGMTYEDLMDGMLSFYVATNSIVQFNWSNRTTAFKEGWSFTIAQGALLPYRTSNGTSYMTLDKEYTFAFRAGNAQYDNIVAITGHYTTTFSLGNLTIWGNGTSGSTNLNFTDSNVSGYNTKYSSAIYADEVYADYVKITDVAYEDMESSAVKIRYILDGSARCIQIEDWGTLRESMGAGDQLIFYKGFPIYYTDASGNSWKAALDDTYVYECTGSNTDHTQVFYGVKMSSAAEYGMKTYGSNQAKTTGAQSSTNSEQFSNLGFDASSSGTITHSINTDVLNDTLAEDYVQVADYTAAEARKLGIAIRFIPNANVIQVGFSEAAVASIQVGTQIVLKKGMPAVYMSGGTLCSAILDAEYTITITANNGTNLSLTCVLTDTYSLKGTISGPTGPEGGYYYYGMPIQPDAFADIQTRTEARFDDTVWKNYLTLSAHTAGDITADGSYMRWYGLLSTVFQGVRFYSNLSFANGEELIVKKGLPITYTTADSKTKVISLDKDYGFVYSASTGKFTYDSTIGNEPEEEVATFTLSATTPSVFYEVERYRLNIGYTSESTITSDTTQTEILTNSETAQYIDMCGIDTATLIANGVEVRFIPSATCFQLVLGSSMDWLSLGSEITFMEGMPVRYTSGGITKKFVLEKTTVYKVTALDLASETQTATFTRYAASAEFALETNAIGTGIATDGSASVTMDVLDPATGAQSVLDDMKDPKYVTLDDATVANYIDFCGMTTEELKSYGVKFVLIRDGSYEDLQIQWGTSAQRLEIGARLIFKQGMPIAYDTTDGYHKIITLDKDYIFEVTEGNSGNIRVLQWTDVVIGGTWGLVSGKTYHTSQGTGEGYYDNIHFASGDLINEVSSLNLTFDTDTMDKYVSFGNIDREAFESAGNTYITAIAIITANDKVLQLRWGDTTEHMSSGDEIIFKEGMPIVATGTDGVKRLYTLDADYSFVLETNADSINGFVITGMRKVSTIIKGDMDEDYLLNKNDVSLIRKQLADLIAVSDYRVADATENDTVDSKDLVRAKKEWNEVEPENYTTIYKDSSEPDTVASGSSVTYTINADIDTKNYIRLTFKTTQNLYGTFNYTGDNGTAYTENFYLASNEVQFEHFFDNYRKNGLNVGGKTLTSIVLENVGTLDAQVLLNEVEISDRVMVTDDMLWAQTENGMKIGVDLNMGGALGYLESLKYNPVEVVNSDASVVTIETDASGTSYDTYGNVNLVNIYDLGRQMQQSFYIDVQDNDYTHGTYQNQSWPYNPVQAGDKNGNQSQIIDYRSVDTDEDGSVDMIYIKTRAMDWADPTGGSGLTTKSYMENWYRIVDNLLYVDNAFVNWMGFVDPGSYKTQELPAFYTGQSLNYFVAGNDTSNRATYGDWTDLNEGFHVDGTAISDWYAWVGKDADDAFGLGIYIPGATACTAGRCVESNSYSLWKSYDGWRRNQNADDALMLDYGYTYLNNMYKHGKQNCFLYNTSYIAPTVATILQEYKSYEYTYVLTADKLDQMATTFETLDASGAVANTEMKTLWGAWEEE